MVPGGKKMELDQSFEVERKGPGGVMTEVQVSKVAVAMKDIPSAVRDLEMMKTGRYLLNPHGSAVMNRVSSDSLIRSFDKEQAAALIGSLRGYAGVSMLNTSGKKRARDDDDEFDSVSKRPKFAAYDF
jgi:hypothetical protein